jgi:selenocysteine lyase/cysteine desulfurase
MQVTDPAHCLSSPIVGDARRFETSIEAVGPLAGIAASIQWRLATAPIAASAAHARALNAVARSALARSVGGLDDEQLHGDAHLLCIDVPGDAHALSAALEQRGILVRSLSASRLRVSLGPWNSTEDLVALADALAEEISSAG